MNLFQVDSFTDEPFKGNPAGVCLFEKPRPESWMLSAAREMNLSETAFLLPQGKRPTTCDGLPPRPKCRFAAMQLWQAPT